MKTQIYWYLGLIMFFFVLLTVLMFKGATNPVAFWMTCVIVSIGVGVLWHELREEYDEKN